MLKNDTVDALKKQLQAVISQDPMDYDLVTQLSNELVLNDPNYVRFTVDAAHVSRLGHELVARQETAVSELVKNAFDADASWVELNFWDTDEAGGRLVITDDGAGMSREQLISGFMRLSSQDKVREPVSSIYGRQRAGRKGIGRFAAQRLGSQLTVMTRTHDSSVALQVTIDWKRFKGGAELNKIANKIEEVDMERSQGTTLVIDELNESWNEASITRVYRYLADLIQPFPLSTDAKRPENDPGFNIRLYRNIGYQKTAVANVESMVYDHALAEINAEVDEHGNGFWSVRSKSLGINDEKIRLGRSSTATVSPFAHLRNIKMRAYYYIYNAGHIPRNQNAFIRDLATKRGGIRLYRNGFRVLPYGEPHNDWLELDSSSSRRLILPPHSNINYFGFIEVRDPEGIYFEETSSREGLISNDAYAELVSFAYRLLRGAAVRVASVRERKTTAGQIGWRVPIDPADAVRVTAQRLVQVASELRDGQSDRSVSTEIDAAKRQNNDSGTPAEILIAIADDLNNAARQQEAQDQYLLRELDLLRVLASLGLSIGEFSHEVKHILPAITAEANYLKLLHMDDGKAQHHVELLTRHIGTLRNFTAYFGRAIEDNSTRETRPQELGIVVRTFHQTIEPVAKSYGIDIDEPKIRGLDLFTCPMHPSEWVSLLMNLFTNSKKAIDRAASKGKILLAVGCEGEQMYVEFSDNGDGVAEANEQRIFDAFFTTSSVADNLSVDNDEARGTGLGLKIVRDILDAYSGTVRLVSPPQGYRTCFRIEVRPASEKELADHGY